MRLHRPDTDGQRRGHFLVALAFGDRPGTCTLRVMQMNLSEAARVL
jgi:hypothetical protein